MIQPDAIAIYSTDQELLEKAQSKLSPLLPVALNPAAITPHTLVFVDDNAGKDLSTLTREIPAHLLCWIGRADDHTHVRLIQSHGLRHLMGFDPIHTPEEMERHTKKLLAKKIWGLAPYLASNIIPDDVSLSESKREMTKIDEIIRQQDWSEFFDSPIDYLTLVANELVSNALYNGPEEKRTNTDYPVDRKNPVFLKGSELVQVHLGIDAHLAALSVVDCFGTLTWEKVIENLNRSFTEKTVQHKKGGAGLGLYLAYSHANQFVVNRRPGLRTEVICLIEKNRRYKTYKQRLKSFHFFEEAH